MNANLKKNLSESGIWIRALQMILFLFIYNVAEVVAIAVVLLQFLMRLVTGKTNLRLLEFGQSLSLFIYQVWRFLMFITEEKPFPFDNWPKGG